MVHSYYNWLGMLLASPFLEACMMPSGIMKASLWGEGFQVRPSLGPLSPVSDVHSVFINTDLNFPPLVGNKKQ